jgi:phospholipase C
MVTIDEYFADAAAGTLPDVSFVDPSFMGDVNTQSDEHPPANAQVGQAFVAGVIDALMESPLWPSSALFLTYDEHGGFYDHVPPPPACPPDDIAPLLLEGDTPADFDRYGFRVPLVVVSPFAKKRFVSHVVHDHTSILRFIETRFDLPALTRRDANADPMLEFFDFTTPPFEKPPKLKRAKINPKLAEECLELGVATSGEL